MKTLQQILIECNAYLDLDASVPTGSELATRTNYANQAVWDASAVGQFKELQGVYIVNVGTLATIPLPTGFREFMIAPNLLDSSGVWTPYGEISPNEVYEKNSSDKYCYVLGNPSVGYKAIFNNLTANATLSITYQRYPSGLATLTDICELSDPQFVVAQVESYVLQSRRDERFPVKDAEAQRKLRNMTARGDKLPVGQGVRRIGQSNYVLE